MEKNIVIVVREGLSLRNDNGKIATFNSVGSVESVLLAVQDTLNSIPTNAQGLTTEFTHIYVPGLIGGLLSGLIGLYKRTGTTREGNIISQEEMNLYIAVDKMLKDRSDNVRLVNLKHIRKDDLNMSTLIKKSWTMLDREERKLLSNARAGVAPQANVNVTAEMTSMQQQMLQFQQMMQQQMQQFMQMNMMMAGGQMPNMTMPTMDMSAMNVGMPATNVTPQVPQEEPVETNVGTTITLDANAIAGIGTDSTGGAMVTEYDPEF